MGKTICKILMICELITLFLLCALLLRPHSTMVNVWERMSMQRVQVGVEFGNSTLKRLHKERVYDTIALMVESEEARVRGQELEVAYAGKSITVPLGKYLEVQDREVDGESFGEYEVTSYYLSGLTSGMKLHNTKIEIKYSYDKDKLSAYLLEQLKSENISMTKPRTRFTGSGLEVIEEGTEGRELDEVLLLAELDRLLGSGSVNDTHKIEAVYNTIKVSPTVEELASIDTRVASFSTGYSSSSSSRKKNIAIATRKIDGVILLPGEVYSVDRGIGVRNATNGYEKSGSYLNGKTVQTYGGGVCQVSTTLYGAVLRAGLVPVERNAHSMTVGYVPIGLDAAIAEGYKDLKIENTYNKPIYIEGTANGSSLTFNIYGSADLMGGYTYRPESKSSNGGLKASAWLNKISNGEIISRMQLSGSNYRPHS